MLAVYSLILSASAFLFAAIGTWGLLRLLPVLSVIDDPVERSNHTVPTPRGGGIAVTGAALFFLLAASTDPHLILAVCIAAAISLADDFGGQPVLRRLLAHLLAATLAVLALNQPVFQGLLPLWADRLVSVFLLTYFMNCFNFMDGIDEIAAMETLTIGLGLVACVWVDAAQALPGSLAIDGMILAGAVLGFWLFNRHPAKIFLGDVGSIPLGLISGYLLLRLASEGWWIAAAILPAFFLADASSTLLARAIKGKKLWEAHSEHAYQRAVRRGMAHDTVSRVVLALGMVLIVLAAASSLNGRHLPYWMLGAAYALTIAVLLALRRWDGVTPAPAHGPA